MKAARAGERQWRIRYDAGGRKCAVDDLTQGISETRAYDGLNRLLSITQRNVNDNSIIFKIEYVPGADGNRLEALETRGSELRRWKYEYDALGRLTRERSDKEDHGSIDRGVRYQYDADGNRTALLDEMNAIQSRHTTYYANSQRIYEVRNNQPGGLCFHERHYWTANGELEKKERRDASGTVTATEYYAWGIDGTQRGVRYVGGVNDGYEIKCDYDHQGELVARRTYRNGVLQDDERYLVDHQNLTGYSQVMAVFKADAKTGALRLQTVNHFTDQIVAQTDYDGFQPVGKALLSDGLGSIRAQVTPGAEGGEPQVKPIDYTAFGTTTAFDGYSGMHYAFTGQRLDMMTGMQYHRARWLDGSVGRWISSDIVFDIEGNYGNSIGYVSQNPTNLLDSNGQNADGSTLSFAATAAIMNTLTNIGISSFAYAIEKTLVTAGSAYLVSTILSKILAIEGSISNSTTIDDNIFNPTASDPQHAQKALNDLLKLLIIGGTISETDTWPSVRSQPRGIVYRAASYLDLHEFDRPFRDPALEGFKSGALRSGKKLAITAFEHILRGHLQSSLDLFPNPPLKGYLNEIAEASPFISTTRQYDVALRYAGGDIGRIYSINLNLVFYYIDMGKINPFKWPALGFSTTAMGLAQNVLRTTRLDQEVLCFWYIPPGAISK